MIKTTKKRQAPPTVSTTAKQAKMGEVPSNWYLCENWQKYSDAIMETFLTIRKLKNLQVFSTMNLRSQ